MDCPRCFAVNTLKKPSAIHELHGCVECHGLWMALATADELVRGAHGSLTGLPRTEVGLSALRCPECRQELARHRAGRVEIDVCAKHGVWFDPSEVEHFREGHRSHPAYVSRGAAVVSGVILQAPEVRPPEQSMQADEIAEVVLNSGDLLEIPTAAFEGWVSVLEVLSSLGEALSSLGDG